MFTGPQDVVRCTCVVSINMYVPLLDKWTVYGPPNVDLLVRKVMESTALLESSRISSQMGLKLLEGFYKQDCDISVVHLDKKTDGSFGMDSLGYE